MIRRYEEISMNDWPALQTVFYDGWVLRFADGYTRRANSVCPIYTSTLEVTAKIERCEEIYSRRGLRTIFKMTGEVSPPDLDSVLEGRGYRREAETSVQTLELASAPYRSHGRVHVSDGVDEEWLDGFCRLSRADARHKTTVRSMLESITGYRYLALVREIDAVVACGLGVCDEQTVGLFDIVVDERCRGQGLGSMVTESILAWASTWGARESYLQVMVDNTPALALYARFGFREIYRYWYRVNR